MADVLERTRGLRIGGGGRARNRETRVLEGSSRHVWKLSRSRTGMVLERVLPSQVLTSSRDTEGHDADVCRQP